MHKRNLRFFRSKFNKMGSWLLAPAMMILLPVGVSGQHLDTPRVETGTLLVESAHPAGYLLVSATETRIIEKDEVGFWPAPSISADGNTIASSRRVPRDISFGPRLIAGVYSIKEAKWTEFPEFAGLKAIAISPDGSKLACVTRDSEISRPGHYRLRVLDLKSGEITVLRDSSTYLARPSWSPDGRRIAFETNIGAPYSNMGAIYLVDLQDRSVSRLALGRSPSWSPSGELIAYVGYIDIGRYSGFDPLASTVYAGEQYSATRFQTRVIRTADSHSRLLMGSVNQDAVQPVWSPDSKTLLVTTTRDLDEGTFDIHMLDIATGKHRRLFKKVLPVFAWITPAQ